MSPAPSDRVRRPAFQFYPGDDLLLDEHCRLMSCEALGAHIRLYASAWEGRIPNDLRKLALLIGGGMTEKRLRQLWDEISPAWQEQDGTLVHPKLEAKRAKLEAFVEKQRENGKRGGRPKGSTSAPADESQGEAKETQPFSLANPDESSSSSTPSSPSENTPPGPLASEGERSKGNEPAAAGRRTGGRSRAGTPRSARFVPETWQPRPEDLAYAVERLGGVDRAQAELAKFRDHEFRDGKTDFDKAWRNWVRRAPELGVAAGGGTSGGDAAAGVNVGAAGGEEWRRVEDLRAAHLKAERTWSERVGAKFDVLPEEERREIEDVVLKRRPDWAALPEIARGSLVRTGCLHVLGKRIRDTAPPIPAELQEVAHA